MAGLCKSIKAGAKALKRELTREVLKFGIETMGGFSPLIADGKLTKAERKRRADRLAEARKKRWPVKANNVTGSDKS